MSDCIFCRIVAGEIPSRQVYADDRYLAFLDINPVTRGHLLVIPKAHYETAFTMPEDLLRDIMTTARLLAEKALPALGAAGCNFIQSNGRAANQVIDHYHMHVIPRYREDDLPFMRWELTPGDPADLDAVGAAIRGAF